MNTRVIVCGIIQRQDELLLGKKAKGAPPYPDVWHTIGGGVGDLEKGLKLIQERKYDDAYFHEELRREILEEAGITLKNIKNICPIYRESPREDITKNKHGENTHYYFLEYICDIDQGEPIPGDDIAQLKWINKKDLHIINLTPPSKAMYHELGWMN